MDMLPIRRAILSVTDKSGLDEFARFLQESGVELVSTGGTRKKLLQAGLKVRSVSDVTGFPEILGGRVKTLHPHVHAGILASKDDPAHMQTMKDLRLGPFDLICVNLYNFAEAVRQTLEDRQAVEQIDIGGPTMLRAAAKNFHSVAVLPAPEHYAECMREMRENGGALSLPFRKRMAGLTFELTSGYDHMIAAYLNRS
ncbi:MAG: IMP cyclohydrolase [Pseudomonadota bacterium]|nr:IMP cyclohydrolase [Pseudomonadota bacterium]